MYRNVHKHVIMLSGSIGNSLTTSGDLLVSPIGADQILDDLLVCCTNIHQMTFLTIFSLSIN